MDHPEQKHRHEASANGKWHQETGNGGCNPVNGKNHPEIGMNSSSTIPSSSRPYPEESDQLCDEHTATNCTKCSGGEKQIPLLHGVIVVKLFWKCNSGIIPITIGTTFWVILRMIVMEEMLNWLLWRRSNDTDDGEVEGDIVGVQKGECQQ